MSSDFFEDRIDCLCECDECSEFLLLDEWVESDRRISCDENGTLV